MRKRGVIAVAIVGILGVASLLLLNRYKTDMIHATIQSAVLQKAPPDYSQEQIRQRFNQVLLMARETNGVELHLKRLLALAQRLEKIQHLGASDVDLLLQNLDQDPAVEVPNESRERTQRPQD